MAIGDRIKAVMAQKGITQTNIAEKLGIDYTTVGRQINKDDDSINLNIVKVVAELGQVSLEQLVYDTEARAKEYPADYQKIKKELEETKNKYISLLEKISVLKESL